MHLVKHGWDGLGVVASVNMNCHHLALQQPLEPSSSSWQSPPDAAHSIMTDLIDHVVRSSRNKGKS
jgi:hypothetical protein